LEFGDTWIGCGVSISGVMGVPTDISIFVDISIPFFWCGYGYVHFFGVSADISIFLVWIWVCPFQVCGVALLPVKMR